jgi:HD-GYP domain-containing protein (c-di-GMP phosphodiesterase class II)
MRLARGGRQATVESSGAWRGRHLRLAPVFPRRLRDHWLEGHAAEVAELALGVGRKLGLTAHALFELELAARLHDVGKRVIPYSILNKPGALTRGEWAMMQRHPEWGSSMLAEVPGLEGVADAVYAHHEWWDGSGYPRGLAGEEIPPASLIVAVCDAFSAMTSERPYRAARSRIEAVAELRVCAGSQFDPDVVDAFAGQVHAAATA